MSIPERIWLILFTVAEGAVPFLCYLYPKSFSYEAMLFCVPIGMAFLYVCLFGKERLFETDVTSYAMLQARFTAVAAFLAMVAFGMNLKKFPITFKTYIFILLILGAILTIFVHDILFAIIFIIIGKIYGMESFFAKQKKKHDEFYEKDSQPYGKYRNIYEKMYWEELEKRQREQFKKKNEPWESNHAEWNSGGEHSWEKAETKENWEQREVFLFENTRYFQSISSLEQVRSRYISLMKKYHPDMPEGSKEIAQEIQNEYDRICEENGL